MNGTIALANVTQSGLSGAVFASPTEPPLRTYDTGSSSHNRKNSGAAKKSTTLPSQAGERQERGRRWCEPIALPFFSKKAVDSKEIAENAHPARRSLHAGGDRLGRAVRFWDRREQIEIQRPP